MATLSGCLSLTCRGMSPSWISVGTSNAAGSCWTARLRSSSQSPRASLVHQVGDADAELFGLDMTAPECRFDISNMRIFLDVCWRDSGSDVSDVSEFRAWGRSFKGLGEICACFIRFEEEWSRRVF